MATKKPINKQKLQMQARGVDYKEYNPGDNYESAYEKFINAKAAVQQAKYEQRKLEDARKQNPIQQGAQAVRNIAQGKQPQYAKRDLEQNAWKDQRRNEEIRRMEKNMQAARKEMQDADKSAELHRTHDIRKLDPESLNTLMTLYKAEHGVYADKGTMYTKGAKPVAYVDESTALGRYAKKQHERSGQAYVSYNRKELEEQFKRDNGVDDKGFKLYQQYLKEAMNTAEAEDLEKISRNYADKHPLAANATDVVVDMPAGFMATAESLRHKFDADPYSNVNTNSALYRAQSFQTAVENQTNENIAAAINNPYLRTAAQVGYGAGLSTAKMVAPMALGGFAGGIAEGAGAGELGVKLATNAATLPSFGASAYSHTLKEAQDRGLSRKQATQLAVVSALSEMGTEVVSLDVFWDIAKQSGVKVARNRLANWLVMSVIEGGEEGTNDIINRIADDVITGDQSEYNSRVRELIESEGLTEEEAKKVATHEYWAQVGTDVLAGSLSGGLMGGGANVMQSRSYAKTAKHVNAGDYMYVVDELPLEESAYENKEGSDAAKEAVDLAQELAKKAEEGTEVTKKEKMRLVELVDEARQNMSVRSEEAETPAEEKRSKAEIMADMSKAKNARELTKAYHEAVENISAENRQDTDTLFNIKAGQLNLTTDQVNSARMSDADVYNAGYENKRIEHLTPQQQVTYREGAMKRFEEEAKARAAAEVTGKASNDEGKEFTVKEIKSLDSKDMTLLTDDGEVKLSQVKFANDGEQTLYNQAAQLGSVAAAKAYVDNYVPGMPVDAYDRVAQKFYTAGQLRTSFDSMRIGPVEKQVGTEGLRALYDAGMEVDKAESKIAKKTTTAKKGEGRLIDSRENKGETLHRGFLGQVAEKFGIDIEITDSLAADKNGTFEPAMGRLVLNTNNPDMYKTLFHELSEFGQAYNAEGMDDLRVAMMEYVMDKAPDSLRQSLIAYQNAYKQVEGSKSISEASEELFNDLLSEIFRDEAGIRDFVNWVVDTKTETEAEGLIQRLAELIHKICNSITKYVSGNRELTNVQKTAAEMDVQRAQEMRSKLLQAFDEAIKNRDALAGQEGQAEVRHSLEVDTEGRKLAPRVKKFFKNSKLVDEQGRLKEMYHGTRYAGFTVFQLAQMDDGMSIFLTDKNKVAKTYAGTYDFYEPDRKWSFNELETAVSYATGGDWEVEQTDSGVRITELGFVDQEDVVHDFATTEAAQDYFINNYLNKMDLKSSESAAVYRVYGNATNPLVVDADNNYWNELPVNNWKKHYGDVDITKADGSYEVEYMDGVTHEWHHDVFDSMEALEQKFGKLPELFGFSTAFFNDLYLDRNGKRVPTSTREYAQYAKENGYDSVIIKNVVDSGLYGNTDEQTTPSTVAILFNPNQVKSIYNQNPTENEDIRYSIDVQPERVFYTKAGTEVVQNPTSQEYSQMREDILQDRPWLRGSGEPLFRHTYDEQGNEYYWDAMGGLHAQVEPEINKKYNTRTSQQWNWWTREDKDDYPVDYSKRYSINVDSDGRDLTAGQQEFFKNTKAVDSEGRLITMYHGTPNGGFTVFNRPLNFFTPRKEYAQRYADGYPTQRLGGDIYEVYLNIEKPFDISDRETRRIFIEDYVKGGWSYSIDPSTSLKEIERRITDGIDWTEADNIQEFIEENELDYDGIILNEGGDPVDGEVVYRGNSYVVFNSNQIKRVDNANPTKDEDIRFSLEVPVEESGDLVAVHNIHSGVLMETLKLGGFPMPSIAVIKREMGFDKYGNVTVLFNKDAIDPKKNRANKVYNGDAWTPTFPTVEIKIDEKVAENIRKRIRSIISNEEEHTLGYLALDNDNLSDYVNRNDGDPVKAYKDKDALQYAFLKDKGIDLDIPQTEARLDAKWTNEQIIAATKVIKDLKQAEQLRSGYQAYEKNPELVEELRKALNEQFREKYGKKAKGLKLSEKDLYEELSFSDFDYLTRGVWRYYKNGIQQEMDAVAARKEIKEKIKEHEKEYDKWVRNLFEGIAEKTGLRNNKEYFTATGNRRSWDALHDPYTLENIVKIMKQQDERGEAAFFSQSAIQALSLKTLNSLNEIRKNKDQLRIESEEEHEKRVDEQSKRFSDICTEIMDKSESNQFIAFGRASDAIAETVKSHKTVAAIDKELREWRTLNIREDTAQKIVDLMNDIAKNPTGYFEAKPRRAVMFDEIADVIVPDDETDLINELDSRGIPHSEYKAGNEESRKEVLNKAADDLPNTRFSLNVDTEGNELTPEQQDFYSESKVRDDQGRLLVLYHGTDRAGFTKFDVNAMDDKRSIFLTDNRVMANTYAETADLYQPDKEWDFVELANAVDNATGGDWNVEKTENGIRITEYEMDEDVVHEFKSIRKAQDFFVDNYLNKVDLRTTELSGVYKLYANITNPYIVDAKGRNWNQLPPLNQNVRHLQNVEVWVDEEDHHTYISYTEDGVTKEDTAKNFDNIDEFFKAYGINDKEQVYWFESNYVYIDDIFLNENGERTTGGRTREYTEYAEKNGYDGVIFENILDTGKHTYFHLAQGMDRIKPSKVVVAFNANQVKSTENKAPTANEDIRYALNIDNDFGMWDTEDLQGTFIDEDGQELDLGNSVINAEETISGLARYLQAANEPLKGHKVNASALQQIAEDLVKKYNSTADVNVVADNLKIVFDYLQKTDDINYNEITKLLSEVSRPIIEQSGNVNEEMVELYEAFKGYIKNQKIALTDGQKKAFDLTPYGSFNNYRKANFGTLNFVNDGASLDSLWTEMCEKAKGFLDVDTNEEDMGIALADALTAMKPQAESLYGYDAREASIDLAGQIMEAYYKAEQEAIAQDMIESGMASPTAKYMIESARKDMKKEIMDYRKKTKELYTKQLEDMQGKISEIMAANNALAYDVRNLEKKNEQLTKKMAEQVVKAKARNKTTELKRYVEAEEIKKQKEEINKIAIDLLNRATNPTNKKYMQEGLRKPIAEFLTGIDFVSHRARLDSKNTIKWTDRMQALRKYLSNAAKGDEPEAIGIVLDPDLIEDMDRFATRNSEVAKVSKLPSWDLKELHSILSRLRTAVNKSNEMFTNELYKNQVDFNQAAYRELKEQNSQKNINKFMNGIRDFLNKDLEDPVTYFELLGETHKTLFDSLLKGFDKRAEHIREYVEFMKKLQQGKEQFYKWENKKHTFQLEEGTLEITEAQIMSLYETMQREQAKGHILPSGFKVSKVTVGGKEIIQNKPVRIKPAEYLEIINTLSAEQKEVADAIQKFMAVNCAKWGNNTSMKLFGYKKFNEKNYFPIKTDATSRDTNQQDVSKQAGLWANKNMSASKELTIGANNAIVIGDIFDVFADHVTDMATYDGMVLPQMDAMRWFNYRAIFKGENETGEIKDTYSIKEQLQRLMGTAGTKYFENLMLGINGMEPKARSASAMTKFIGNYKKAAVTAKIRVAIQQPTAIIRALDEMNGKYISKALATTNFAKYSKIAQEKSNLAWWKAQGYYEAYLGKSIKDMAVGKNPALQAIDDYAGFGAQKADDLTWGALYHAVEYEIADTTDLKPGTEAFDAAVVDRFEDVVTKTQVVDTMIHRTDIMRNQNDFVKLATSFMAEPLKTYNMCLRSIAKFARAPHDKKMWRKLMRTIIVYTLNNAILTAVTSSWDAVRDDDDKTPYSQRWIDRYSKEFVDNMNPVNMLPYVKDVVELFESRIKGEYYSSTDMATAGFDKAATFLVHLGKVLSGEKINKTPYGLTLEGLQAIQTLSGMPIYNVVNDINTVHNGLTDNWETKQSTSDYGDLHKAITKSKDVKEEVQELLEMGKDKSGIKSSITGKFKEEYQEATGEDKQQIRENVTEALVEAGYTQEEAQNTLDKWDGVEVTEPQYEEYHSDYESVYDSIDKGGNVQSEVQKMLDSGKQPAGIKSAITRKYKDQLVQTRDANLRNALVRAYMAAGDTNEEANEKIESWLR